MRFDFLTKPLIDEELQMAIERAFNQRRVIEENKTLKAQLDLRFGLENIVGHDHRMLRVFDMIDSVADTAATVLITGESGTGKSLIARAIHRRSPRRDKPFVEVACGALPETLLESELFGHVAGSFTGAIGDKIGKFLQADGGTIFLDEIGTASPSLQVKLLRVLQDFEFEPVGGTKTFKVDSRVILATNEDLAKLVAEGRFRQDLYYRVNVINIELPPLRERISDIPLLAGTSWPACAKNRNARSSDFADDALLACSDTAGRATSASCKTWSSGPCCWAKETRCGWKTCRPPCTAPRPGRRRRSADRTLKEALEAPERQIILEVLERQQLEPQRHGRRAGHQPHDALQEDEAAGAGRQPPRATDPR